MHQQHFVPLARKTLDSRGSGRGGKGAADPPEIWPSKNCKKIFLLSGNFRPKLRNSGEAPILCRKFATFRQNFIRNLQWPCPAYLFDPRRRWSSELLCRVVVFV